LAEQYYTDQALTNVAAQRKKPTFVAQRLMPNLTVTKMTGKFWKLDPNDQRLIIQDTKRAPAGKPKPLYSDEPSSDTYTVEEHASSDVLPDSYKAQMDAALVSESNKVERIVDYLDLLKEYSMLSKLFAGLTNVSAPSTKFDDYTSTTFDPIKWITDLFAQIEDSVGASPNVLAMDAKVGRALIQHPAVKERVVAVLPPSQFNNGLTTIEKLLAAILGLDEVMLATGSVRNTAKKGGTKSIVRNWSDNMVLGFREDPSLEYSGMGLHFVYEPDGPDGEVVNGKQVIRERLSEGRKADFFAVYDNYDQKVVNTGAGLWIPDVLT
jgi:hypothetical protein